MMHYERDFIDEIQKILSLRKKKRIEHYPFSKAAVLVPLFQKDKDCCFLLTKRSNQLKYHKGQICFPGGGLKEGDSGLENTALREAFEEIGLNEGDVRIIGLLDDVVANTSGFIITPIIGIFPYPYPFKVSKVEIAELIEVPLPSLLNHGSFDEREVLRGDRKEVVCVFQYGNHIIWGATAQILKQFLDLIRSI